MWTRLTFADLIQPPVIGMLHLHPLPGSPGWGGDWGRLELAALADAAALAAGGVGAILVENYHDVPFWPDRVPPVTVAALTRLVTAVCREHSDLPIGVNVLRNDAAAALSIAAVSGARFIRVNVHAGVAVTDQGLLAGQAHQTLRWRRELGAAVAILADAQVKHARPLAARPLAEEAADIRHRGLADGIILTGAATGAALAAADLPAVREALPDCPLLAGSGLNETNVASCAAWVDGYIVGTALKETTPTSTAVVSQEKVARFVAAALAAAERRDV